MNFSKGSSADNKAHHGGANDNEECTRMLEIATSSMKELIVLMETKSLWTKPSDDVVGFVLVPERYENMFPRENHIESSKDSKVVPIGGLELVEMLLDSEKWANLFPTIVSEAKTLKVFDVGSYLNRNGTLQLMYAKIHIFLPQMAERGFYFLRYCEQIDSVTWGIADVSFSFFGTLVDTPWRHPSGCMIRDMSDGTSMVTWIEHVEVDDRVHRNNVCSFIRKCASNEATKWLLALQRKCQKNICTSIDYVARHHKG
ncbi:homeobox-leucine zipper protein HDG12-like [Cicer arietinum]|uniref:homeobox-leucine zipper protein HDG12-like n=1 Tax=Cicer arietinum TaxID=3827 RepID=UPI003CC64C1E